MGCRRILFGEAGHSKGNVNISPSQSSKAMPAARGVGSKTQPVPTLLGDEADETQYQDIPCTMQGPPLMVVGSEGLQTPIGATVGGRSSEELNRPAPACQGAGNISGPSNALEFSPMATVTESQIATPEGEQLYKHHDRINHALVPMEGMSFKSDKLAKKFYRRYAKLAGFSVVMRNKKTYSRVMRCNRFGEGKFYKGDEALRVRNNTSKKTECKAYLKFKRVYDSDGNEEDMVLEKAQLYHNHELQPKPEITVQMRGHKSKEPVVMEIIDDLQASGATNQCIRNVLEDMHGGPENMPITDRDIENRKAANVRKEHADDINKLLEFFKDCEAQNPQFHWAAKVDSGEVIHSLFWSHASMQGDYADFGDVISFDTTHKTNIYKKPLAMFVGSNHRLQNTLFACALLGDETQSTFEWTFRAFKKCMGNMKTRCIITDQDQAMAAAIAKEFPGIIHRICRWHVVNKMRPLVNSLYALHAKKNFREKFNSVLNHPLTPLEFEAAWKELLDEFKLHDDSTLESLFRDRKLYIPAYFKGDYCGRMASTQRSESANFVMKKCFVDKQTALHRFAKKTLSFVHKIKMKEASAEYHATSKILTKGKWQFEVQVSRIYTREVFMDFEKKMVDCTAYEIEDPKEGRDSYLVRHTNRSSKISWGQHRFEVIADKVKGEFHCECNEWEHTGLFCVHLLRAFIRIQLIKIPAKYILKRYTIYAKNELAFDRRDKVIVGADGVTQCYRTQELTKVALAVARSGSMSTTAFERTLYVMKNLYKETMEIPHDVGPHARSGQVDPTGEGCSRQSTDDGFADEGGTRESGSTKASGDGSRDGYDDEEGINEIITGPGQRVSKDENNHISRVPPPRAKAKGRLIPPMEKKEIQLGAKGEKKGTRKCSKCKLYAMHNSRTCPTLEHNKQRLEEIRNKKRGRPPGTKNKCIMMDQNNGVAEDDLSMTPRRGVHSDGTYTDHSSADETDDEQESDDDCDTDDDQYTEEEGFYEDN